MIVRCMFASQWAEMCAPKSSKEDEAIKGKWVRVDPDLNIQSGMWHLVRFSFLCSIPQHQLITGRFSYDKNVYYRRTRRLDVRLITNIQLLPTDAPEPPPSTPGSTWTKADLSIRDGVYKTEPLFLWFETGKTAGEMTAEEKQSLITEIDVTYGDGNPWFGFEKLSPATTERQEGLRENVWLTYRKGVKGMYFVDVNCSIVYQLCELQPFLAPRRCTSLGMVDSRSCKSPIFTYVLMPPRVHLEV